MKKTVFAIASITLAAALGSSAFAQSPTGPADGTNRAAPLPAGSAARPAGEGSGAMAPRGADGTTKAPSMSGEPRVAAPGTPKPGGEGSSAMAPMGADGTPKSPAASGGKESRKMASEARKSRMKAANKSGEIPSPAVNPKSY